MSNRKKFCPYCGEKVSIWNVYCQSCGHKIEKFALVSYISFGLLLLLSAVVIIFYGNYTPPSGKSMYSACFDQLSHIKTGIESYIGENDRLSDIDPYADAVCNHVLAGFDKPEDCKGQVKERVDQVCDNFKVTVTATSTYNITGNSKDQKTHCGICVTESGAYPNKYDDCGNASQFVCEQARDIRYNSRR